MTDDLVQRLRTIPDRAIFVKGGLVYEDYEDVMEAADRIEEMDRHLILSGKMSKALSDRIEALEEDIERLREALNWYVMDDEKYIRAAL